MCFPKELNDGIGQQCRELKPGARILSLKMFEFDTSDFLEVKYALKVAMTWGI